MAIIAVVFLHASSDYVWGFTGKTAIDWLVVNSFYSLSVLGVPIFFYDIWDFIIEEKWRGR